MTTPPPVEPRFATPRDPAYPTRGTRQGHFARIWLGQPLMPWQQQLLDVAGELDATGLVRYPLVVATLQRQAGKSHLCMARKGERCFCRPGFRGWYTAQTGGDARDQFLKFGEQVDEAPLHPFVRTLVGNGREIMKFPNGSWIRPHPPTKKALHGKQSDDNDVDEAWAFSEEEGRELLQAISPTQLTRPGAQTWIWSAGGTAESTWLAELVARGREGDPSMCYVEYAIPDQADAEDLDVIAAHHPAYGHTIGMPALRTMRTQFEGDAAGWARAAGNRWTEVIGGAIADGDWTTVRAPDPIPHGVPVGYGAARSADGTQVAIAVAAQVGDRVVIEILDVLPSAFGAADHVAGWATDGPVAIATEGPSATLVESVERAGRVDLVKVSSRDYSVACANVVDGIDARRYLFRQHPKLDDAIKVAVKRSVGDGGFVWSRNAVTAPIATLEAATLAALTVTRTDHSTPVIYFGT